MKKLCWISNNWPWPVLIVFLLPVSVMIGGVGVSANYSYLALLLFLRPIRGWPVLIKVVVVYTLASFLISLVVSQGHAVNNYLRQGISFVLYLAPLLLTATRLPFNLRSLLYAVTVVSAIYSAAVLFVLIGLNQAGDIPLAGNAGTMKARIAEWIPDWPQRYIVVVLFGYFAAVWLSKGSRWWLSAAALCVFCIMASYGRVTHFAFLTSIVLLTSRGFKFEVQF